MNKTSTYNLYHRYAIYIVLMCQIVVAPASTLLHVFMVDHEHIEFLLLEESETEEKENSKEGKKGYDHKTCDKYDFFNFAYTQSLTNSELININGNTISIEVNTPPPEFLF